MSSQQSLPGWMQLLLQLLLQVLINQGQADAPPSLLIEHKNPSPSPPPHSLHPLLC